jgi:hypothetical protein
MDLFINLTYKTPHEDVESFTKYQNDGKVDVKYILTSMCDLLTSNVDKLNKLLENVDNIEDIVPIGYGIIQIKMGKNGKYVANDMDAMKDIIIKLMDDKVLMTGSDFSDSDEYEDAEEDK